MEAIHIERLLNVAKALREEAERRRTAWLGPDDRFTMHVFANACGTPACALGTYAASKYRGDFRLALACPPWQENTPWIWIGDNETTGYSDPLILNHFDLSADEAMELFDKFGCGEARSEEEAALYIEAFVDRQLSAA